MERKRQREMALAAVAVLSIAVVVYAVRTSSAPDAASLGVRRSSDNAASSSALAQKGLTEVDISAPKATKEEPQRTVRNPFRFKAKPPPPPSPPSPSLASIPTGPGGLRQTGPPEPAPVPRIPLKFFGIIEVPGKGLNAQLTDGRGVYRGFVGDTIEGRYRILRIGVESIDLADLEGRGRQTIRFTGQ